METQKNPRLTKIGKVPSGSTSTAAMIIQSLTIYGHNIMPATEDEEMKERQPALEKVEEAEVGRYKNYNNLTAVKVQVSTKCLEANGAYHCKGREDSQERLNIGDPHSARFVVFLP
jgi:hypothetical protein